MVKSIYTAMSGALARLRQLDLASSNLTQTETPGYRQQRETYESVAMRGGTTPLGFHARLIDRDLPADSQAVKRSGARVSTRAGAMVQTGRSLDLAIEGPGFFQTAEKSPQLTRDGRLHVDAGGNLVTHTGIPVAVAGKGGGKLRIPLGAALQIQEDGQIVADGRSLGRLKIVGVKDPGALQPRGAGLFATVPGDDPKPVGGSRVMAGFIEQSNVDPLQALVEIIAAERGFELAQKVVQTSGDLDSKAATEVGTPRT